MTLRKQDYQSEMAVAQFLDEHFYPKYVTDFRRYDDKATQLKGIDVTFQYQGKNKIVDEKAAAHYVNKNLPTFAFEIDFIGRDKKLHEGWFLDEKKQTEYYLLTWIWATKDKGFTCADILQLDVVLVRRKEIQNMLYRQGLTKISVLQKAHKLRTNGTYGVTDKTAQKPYYYYYTKHLVEQPINLIIKKKTLQELSVLCERIRV